MTLDGSAVAASIVPRLSSSLCVDVELVLPVLTVGLLAKKSTYCCAELWSSEPDHDLGTQRRVVSNLISDSQRYRNVYHQRGIGCNPVIADT